MKRPALWMALATVALAGCTFSRSGSEAIAFNPFAWFYGEPALAPAHDSQFDNGQPLDMRR